MILHNDTNTKGYTQFFFFSVKNTKKGQLYTFYIDNMAKSSSMFKYGMQPVVFSYLAYTNTHKKWERSGLNISFSKNCLYKETQDNTSYYSTLKF